MLETPPSPETPGKEGRRREEDSLFRRYAANRDPALREALAERYLPLVRSLARRYAHGSEPMDDLVQVGSIGLLNAIERYDPENGTAFSSFAVPTILGEIKRHFRDRTWSVRVPRSLQELAGRVRVTEVDLEAKLGRSPTAAELAAELGTDVEELLNARAVAAGHYAVSLDRTMGEDDADGQTVADRFTRDGAGLRRRRRRLHAVATDGGARRADARDPAAALRAGPHAVRDRRARGHLADARLAAHPGRHGPHGPCRPLISLRSTARYQAGARAS